MNFAHAQFSNAPLSLSLSLSLYLLLKRYLYSVPLLHMKYKQHLCCLGEVSKGMRNNKRKLSHKLSSTHKYVANHFSSFLKVCTKKKMKRERERERYTTCCMENVAACIWWNVRPFYRQSPSPVSRDNIFFVHLYYSLSIEPVMLIIGTTV